MTFGRTAAPLAFFVALGAASGANAQPPSEDAAEAASTGASSAGTSAAARDPALSLYLMHMRSAGLLDNTEATEPELEGLLQAAQDRYVAGDALGSAVLLYELSHNPRYDNFQGLPVMESADYHLGIALEAYGAELSAQEAYRAVIARGSAGSYFRPALRRHVDLALASKDFPRGLAELDLALRGGNVDVAALDEIDASERHYLEGRTAQVQGKDAAALEAFGRVSDKSRFFTAAAYLAGLTHSKNRNFRKAEAAFCAVVGGRYNSTAVYYVDSRYFPVRDLAQLGLGRIAHEERRHGHAFYHYFQIPEESDKLPNALYEAAWTMAEEGEHAVARGLVKDLRESYPNAPQSAEARLLDAMLALYDCDFREAETAFEEFIRDLAPVADHIEEIRKDPAQLRALHEEMLQLRAGKADLSGELPSHRLLLSMLDEDPNYERITHQAAVLRREAKFAGALDIELERVRGKLAGEKTASARTPGDDALSTIGTARDLERAIAGLDRQIREAMAAGADPASLAEDREASKRMKTRVRLLGAEAEKLAKKAPPVGEAQTTDLIAVVDQDRSRIQSLRAQSLNVASKLDDAAASYAAQRLGGLRDRIEDLMGEARMGRIDAVLGAKKKLEIEVQSMAAGRFPSELFGKLQIEGMVGDDEEYWPYQGEYWADEYEDYR